MRVNRDHMSYECVTIQEQPNVAPARISYAHNFIVRDLVRSEVARVAHDKDGWRRPTPYVATVQEADNIYGSLTATDTSGTRNHKVSVQGRLCARTFGAGYDIPPLALGRLPTAGEKMKGLVDARNNVANHQAAVLESLYEFRKTVAFLGESATSINNFIQASERKYFKDAAKALKLNGNDPRVKKAIKSLTRGAGTVGQAFLAFSFGVKPIISDMVSALIFINQAHGLRVTGKSLVLYDRASSMRRRQALLTSWGPSISLNIQDTRVGGVYTRLDYEITAEYLRHLTAFGLMNAPEVVWAVQPYSWLIDFVLPVSDVLSAMTATHGLRFKGGSATTFRVHESALESISGPSSSSGWQWQIQSFEYVKPKRTFRKDVNREVLKSDQIPFYFYVKDPFHAFATKASFALLAVKLKQHFT